MWLYIYMGVVMGFNAVYNVIMLFVQLQGAVSLDIGVLLKVVSGSGCGCSYGIGHGCGRGYWIVNVWLRTV